MRYIHNNDNKELFKKYKIDCEKCFGFCCVALYFSASEGFPVDKEAGKPCINLQENFYCSVHKDLRKKGLKGCTAYDCFGAGQKVAQDTYKGCTWKENKETAQEMFDVFLVVRQLHEMLWYLTEAVTLDSAKGIKNKLEKLIKETEDITNKTPEEILRVDVVMHREKVNILLRQVSEEIKSNVKKINITNVKNQKKLGNKKYYIGTDLRNCNFVGADLRGTLLIASNLRGTDLTGANLIAADLRDTDVRDANLSEAIFLTQAQINTAKGNSNTNLPSWLDIPTYWEK